MSKPKTIGMRIDIETRSRVDIKAGSYVYAEDPDFAVLVICYSLIRRYAGGAIKLSPVRYLDPQAATGKQRRAFLTLLQDTRFQKHAFNANFERIALSRWLGMGNGAYLDPTNWRCSAIRGSVNGVSGSLEEVARAVRSPVKKDPTGRRLINLFSKPDKKADRFHETGQCWCGADHSADFNRFIEYCKTDVVTEAMVASRLPEIPDDVQAQYEADQRINDRGIRHFARLSRQAVAQVEAERDRLMKELKNLTGLDNPNSNQQMQHWLAEQDYPMTSLDKAHRAEALADPLIPEEVALALELKGAASLSSVSKHKAALKTRCADGRIRGSLQFYGAHTGREAGRGIQPQNLPRMESSLADRRRLLNGAAGRDAPTIAKGTVRSSLLPAKGHSLIVADYNAIEARVLAGLAGEKWAEAEFRGRGKIYEATAEQMFGIDKVRLIASLDACDKCGACSACEIRNQGKVSNLALGYAGGAGALVTMGAEEAGLDIGNYKELHAEWVEVGKPGKFHEWNRDAHDYPELLRLRDLYRDSSPMTVRFWKLCSRAWDLAAVKGETLRFGQRQVLTMMRDGRHNRLVLPSGRSIWYRFARAHASTTDPDRIEARTFIGKSMGVGHTRVETHGGKLTENVVQAVARDILFDLIMRIEEMTAQGWPGRIVLHVHDEVVLEAPTDEAQRVLDDVLELMSQAPKWAPFLMVKGEGKIMKRYGK